MKVLITGVNGFIASHLAKYLFNKQIEVYGTSSKNYKNPNCIETFKLKIGDDFKFKEITFDWVVHCVYDKNLSPDKNAQSIICWSKALKNKGAKNQIFISSISAITGNTSEYSLLKKTTESWFIDQGMVVVRPGLVVGDSGLFKEMIQKVKKYPIIPLVNGGAQNVKLIGVNDLIIEINHILNHSQTNKQINLFYANKFILKDLLKTISTFYNKRLFFLYIPFFILFYTVKLLEVLKINIGVSTQNINGLISNEATITCHINYQKNMLQILTENLKEPK